MKKILSILIIGLVFGGLVGCSSENVDKCEKKFEKNPIATIKIKDYGTIKFELFINDAPSTVANFTKLANDKFYDNLTIHRIDALLAIIQGGDPVGDGSGGPGYTIKGEVEANGHCNTQQNEEGTIAMARSQSYDSAGSQFFINFKDNTQIFNGDNQYAVFGKVIEGSDIMQKVGAAKTIATVPDPKIVIESIRVETFKLDMPEIIKTS